MSEWGVYKYETREQRRRREQRARRAAQQMLDRSEQQLAQLNEEGIVQWVERDYRRLSRQIARLRRRLDRDPLAARDEAFVLSGRAAMLVRVAREAEERERRRREELKREKRAALERLFQATLADLLDPVERDFAYEELQQLIADRDVLASSEGAVEDTLAEVRRRIGEIRTRAQARAAEWRAEQQAAVAEEVAESVVEAVEDSMQEEDQQLREDRLAAVRDLSVTIARLASAQTEQTPAEQDALRETAERLTAPPREEDRRHVVQALYQALQGLGFVVDQPVRLDEQGEDVVLLRARRPAGQCAELRITASGKLDYRFDNYKGLACKQDIDQVMNLLQSVYGIRLSKHRVLWQNPDRISKTARGRGDSVGGATHGG